MKAWTGSLGPRQAKALEKAVRDLHWEGRTHVEINGVVGGTEHRTAYVGLMDPVRPEVLALDEALRERYGFEVTAKNYREIVAEYAALIPEAAKSRPVADNRRSPDEDADLQAKIAEREAGYEAQRQEQARLLALAMEQAPPGAQALIVAQCMEDNSDPMTDYFSNQTTRSVAIGFRTGKREDFRQLHAAAAAFPETAHLGSDEAFHAWVAAERGTDSYLTREGTERRDNYSMGKGNYLSDHGWDGAGSGWVVKSYAFPASWARLTEVAIPQRPEPPAGSTGQAADGTEVTVSEGRNGNAEVRFADKPSPEVRTALKRHGFRWNGRDMCWWGRDAAFAASLAS